MFFGASLACGYSSIKSLSNDFKIQKTIIHNIVSEQLPSDYYASTDTEKIKIQLRRVGVHPDVAISQVEAYSWQKVREILPDVYSAYKLNSLLDIHLIAGSQVLDPNLALSKIHTTGPLTVMATQVASADYSGSVEIDIWFRQNGERLIDNIIDRNLDLQTKIGQEIKTALKNLMQQLETEKKYKIYTPDKIVEDIRGREFVSFEKSDFQALIKLYKENPNRFGGLIYAIEVFGEYYAGLTNGKLEDRFYRHFMASLRGYVLSKEGIDHPQYRDVHKAIAVGLKALGWDIRDILGEIDWFNAIRDYEGKKAFIDGIIQSASPFIKNYIIEFHYGTQKLGEREKLYTKAFPIRHLVEKGILGGNLNTVYFMKKNLPDYIDLKKNGLNMVYGGGGTERISLPLYDIAIMVALGFSAPKIAGILQREYGIFTDKSTFESTIMHKLNEVFGGVYTSQKEFLKPIIEHLDYVEGISRHDIYLAFKHAELAFSWFLDWGYGKEYLTKDVETLCTLFNLDSKSSWDTIKPYLDLREQYYLGISQSQWEQWLFEGVTFKKRSTNPAIPFVEELAKVGSSKIKGVVKILIAKNDVNSLSELKYKLHKLEIIKILEQGYILVPEGNSLVKKIITKENFYDMICDLVITPDRTYSPKVYFEKILFSGKTVEMIWDEYHDNMKLL
jgi:hypothetical protein